MYISDKDVSLWDPDQGSPVIVSAAENLAVLLRSYPRITQVAKQYANICISFHRSSEDLNGVEVEYPWHQINPDRLDYDIYVGGRNITDETVDELCASFAHEIGHIIADIEDNGTFLKLNHFWRPYRDLGSFSWPFTIIIALAAVISGNFTFLAYAIPCFITFWAIGSFIARRNEYLADEVAYEILGDGIEYFCNVINRKRDRDYARSTRRIGYVRYWCIPYFEIYPLTRQRIERLQDVAHRKNKPGGIFILNRFKRVIADILLILLPPDYRPG
ncbi:MAG: hypothetical protein ACLP51_05795 [Syntrophobacteraceae bacterium]